MKLFIGLATAVLLGIVPAAFAQTADLQTTYANTRAECSSPAKLITIDEGKIEGPGFSCALAKQRPAGTGVWVYDATCTINGKSVSGNMGMGVSMGPGPEFFSISLPGGGDWMDIHPCKKP